MRPEYLALIAALCNSTIGIFSKYSFHELPHPLVSFYRCLGAFIIISIIMMANPKARASIGEYAPKMLPISLCALFGMFGLPFFEQI